MKLNTSFRILSATAILGLLAACGGGGGLGGGEPEQTWTPISPMTDMSMEGYEKIQKSGIIAGDGEKTQFSSLASTRTSNAPFNTAVGRRDGSLTISAGRTNGADVENPNVVFTTGGLDDNPKSYNENYGNGTNNIGQPIIESDSGTVNGQGVYIGRRNDDAQTTSVVYIPREDSDMYVGGYISDVDGIRGFHGVFGRETTTSEMNQLVGSATYGGVAAASVNRYQSGVVAEGGLYEGTSTANVNFDTNQFNMSAGIGRDRAYSNGRDDITITSSGSFDASGKMTGSATYSGLEVNGQTVQGDLEGRFFGPRGQSIGATFIGTAESGDNFGHIVGHTTMNQD